MSGVHRDVEVVIIFYSMKYFCDVSEFSVVSGVVEEV